VSRRPALHGFALVPKTLKEPVEDVYREEELVVLLSQSGECGEAGGDIAREELSCNLGEVHKGCQCALSAHIIPGGAKNLSLIRDGREILHSAEFILSSSKGSVQSE